MGSIGSIFRYSFMIRAMLVGIPVSLCAALLGVSLVLKRYSMIGDGLSHVGFGAMAIAVAMHWSPLPVAIPVVILAAFLLLRLRNDSKIKGDTAIALISTSALALGVMVVSATSGLNSDVSSYMFGSIYAVGEEDVILSLSLALVVLILFVLLYNRIFAVTFDETFSKATGVKADLYNMLIAVLTAVTVVLGMRMMGALLISALIVFPATSAMRICRSFRAVVLCAACISVCCFFAGLVASCLLPLPPGGCIVAANAVVFCIFSLAARIKAG